MGAEIEVGRARARAKERFLPNGPQAHHPFQLGHTVDRAHWSFADPDPFGGGNLGHKHQVSNN